jgi:hypothetical protein
MLYTAQEQEDNLVRNAFHRETEVDDYQTNIDNYTLMLQALPQGEWPAEIAQYAAVTVDKLPPDMPDETVLLISNYQFRDRLKATLRTEKVEQSKANHVKNALKTRIGAGYDGKLNAFKNAHNAAQAVQEAAAAGAAKK